ncbi:MAG: 30S ribosomal protein S17 [Nitrospiria bacterium]
MLKKRKEFVGRVVSDKMDKTVVVAIDRVVKEPRYKKYIKRTTKLKAHDEKNDCHVGDQVKLIETRPLSTGKKWAVLEVLVRAT